MKAKVAALRVTPETVLDDIDRLISAADPDSGGVDSVGAPDGSDGKQGPGGTADASDPLCVPVNVPNECASVSLDLGGGACVPRDARAR